MRKIIEAIVIWGGVLLCMPCFLHQEGAKSLAWTTETILKVAGLKSMTNTNKR